MSAAGGVAAAWRAWRARQVPDARVRLCEVRLVDASMRTMGGEGEGEGEAAAGPTGGASDAGTGAPAGPAGAPERLVGAAEPALAPPLRAFAEAHGLTLAVRFPEPRPGVVVAGHAPLRLAPRVDAGWGSEALLGEALHLLDEDGDFVRVATDRDAYLGWMTRSEVVEGVGDADHRLVALRAHLYAGPGVGSPRLAELAYGGKLRLLDGATGGAQGGAEGAAWARVRLPGGREGFVRRRLLRSIDAPLPLPTADNVTGFALSMLGTPYVWGGVTAWGLDCSGLVQTSYRAHGVAIPRDADQQAAAGPEVAPAEMRAGDLLLFPGHVALALDGRRFVHANGHAMAVTVDAIGADDYAERLMARLERVVRPAGLL